jgi:hypothetical protein
MSLLSPCFPLPSQPEGSEFICLFALVLLLSFVASANCFTLCRGRAGRWSALTLASAEVCEAHRDSLPVRTIARLIGPLLAPIQPFSLTFPLFPLIFSSSQLKLFLLQMLSSLSRFSRSSSALSSRAFSYATKFSGKPLASFFSALRRPTTTTPNSLPLHLFPNPQPLIWRSRRPPTQKPKPKTKS